MRRLDAAIIILFIAIVLGVVMRVAAWHDIANVDVLTMSADSVSYNGIAKNLLAGKGYSSPTHMIAIQGQPTAFYAPTYPFYLVALYYIFGFSTKVGVMSQMIMAVATIPLIYLLGMRLYGRVEGAIASLIYAVSPQIIHYNIILTSETLFFVLEICLSILIVGIFKKDRPSLWMLAVTGLVFGVTYLCRQTVIFLPALIVLGLWLRFKDNGYSWLLKSTGVFLVAAVLLIVPWTVRNYMVFGEPVFSTTTGPATLWWGTYEDKGTPLVVLIERYREGHAGKNEVQMSQMMTKEAIQRLKHMSGADIRGLLHQRVRRLFGFPKVFDLKKQQMVTGLSYLVLTVLGIAGLLVASRGKYERQLLMFTVVLTILLHMFTLSVFRYLMPLVPFFGLGVANLLSYAATRIKAVLQAGSVRLTAS
ncbi:MAG: ArnT family glycosyltransferase [Candidatus Aquicultor sp.]